MWEINGEESQNFQIWKLDTTVGKPLLKANVTNNTVEFSWGTVSNATRYDLRIYDYYTNETIDTLYIDGEKTLYNMNLPAGKYNADIAGYNGIYGTWTFSDKITFSVNSTPTPTPTPKPTPTAKPASTPKPTPTPTLTPQPKLFTLTNHGDSTDIKNISSTSQNAIVIVAEYNSGRLNDIHTYKATFSANETKMIMHDASARVFVWDSLTGMRPLAK